MAETHALPAAAARAVEAPPVDVASEPPASRDPAREILGITSGLLGIAAFVGAWALYDHRLALAPRLENSHVTDPDFRSIQSGWIDARYGAWALAGAGAALGIAATALVMGEEDGTPLWSWLIGAAGLAGVVVGAVEIGTAQTCPDDTDLDAFCVRQAAPIDRGVIVIGMSAPVVSVPLVFLVRELTRGRAAASVELTSDRLLLTVEGAL